MGSIPTVSELSLNISAVAVALMLAGCGSRVPPGLGEFRCQGQEAAKATFTTAHCMGKDFTLNILRERDDKACLAGDLWVDDVDEWSEDGEQPQPLVFAMKSPKDLLANGVYEGAIAYDHVKARWFLWLDTDVSRLRLDSCIAPNQTGCFYIGRRTMTECEVHPATVGLAYGDLKAELYGDRAPGSTPLRQLLVVVGDKKRPIN